MIAKLYRGSGIPDVYQVWEIEGWPMPIITWFFKETSDKNKRTRHLRLMLLINILKKS